MLKIVPMNRSHIQACDEIAAVSEPWKTLNEGIDFKRYISRKQAYVCISRGAVAGFVIFTPDPVFARGGYLRAIGVAPDLRRHGIGDHLLSFAEERTARLSQYLYLCVSSFNRQAQAFYKSNGYAKIGSLPDLIKRGASEYLYWKKLQTTSRAARRRIP